MNQNNLIMKQSLALLSALLLMSTIAFGKERTQAEMDAVAKSVFQTFQMKERSLQVDLEADHLVSDAFSSSALNSQLKAAIPDIDSDYFAVYNSSHGYAIVSTDDRLPALIGFSDSQRFTSDMIPEAMQAMLIQYIMRMNGGDDFSSTVRRANTYMEISPLLGGIKFSQGSPYNDMCPLLNGKRTATGCLATAMAQIMAYHKFPTQMLGDKIDYQTKTHSLPVSWDCTNTRFDWDNILDTYPSETLPDYTANETTTSQQYMSFLDVTLSDKNKLEITDFYSTNGQIMTFDLQLLLCDNNGTFIQPTGQMKTIKDLKPRYGWGTYPINHFLPGDFPDGDYRLYLGVRLTGTSVWSVVQRLTKKKQREEFYLTLTKKGMIYTIEGRTFTCSHTKVQGEAIATLMAACGACTGMNYAEESSTGNFNFGYGMVNYMGYDNGLYFVDANISPTRTWMEDLLITELQQKRPIFCCGITSEGGAHAYVIDGCQYQGTTPYFHVNWGWNGDDDGFFLLDAMTTSGGDNYGYSYIVTLGVRPDDGQDDGILFTVKKVSASVEDMRLSLSLENFSNRTVLNFCGNIIVYAIDGQNKEYALKAYHWDTWQGFSGYGTWDKKIGIPQTLPTGDYTIVLKAKLDGSSVEKELLTSSFPTVRIENPTAINDIPAAAPQQRDVFSLSGRKLPTSISSPERLPKGFYIINGKKYITK